MWQAYVTFAQCRYLAGSLVLLLLLQPAAAGAGNPVWVYSGKCTDVFGRGHFTNADECAPAAKIATANTSVYPTTLYGSTHNPNNMSPGCVVNPRTGRLLYQTQPSSTGCGTDAVGFPCLCKVWTKGLQAGEVFKPTTNFELRLAVAACIDPSGDCARGIGWSAGDDPYCKDTVDAIDVAATTGLPAWATGDGSACPAEVGPMTDWDTSEITSLSKRRS